MKTNDPSRYAVGGRPFKTKPEYYDRCVHDSRSLQVHEAEVHRPHDEPEVGVVITTQGLPRITLSLDAAEDLCQALADVVDHLRGVN